jgi:hypothetical protein
MFSAGRWWGGLRQDHMAARTAMASIIPLARTRAFTLAPRICQHATERTYQDGRRSTANGTCLRQSSSLQLINSSSLDHYERARSRQPRERNQVIKDAQSLPGLRADCDDVTEAAIPRQGSNEEDDQSARGIGRRVPDSRPA